MIHHRPCSLEARWLLPSVRCLLLAIALLITHHTSFITVVAQSTTATLNGTITDQNNAAIPGVSVTVTNVATRLKREAVTNDEGYFTVPLLPPATYTISARRDGFAPIEIPNVVLNVSDQKALQIQLKAGNVSEMVEVKADAPLINESPAVETVIDRQFVANLPLNGRSFQSLLTITPGVVLTKSNAGDRGQISVNGQRGNANYFTIDGVSANFNVFSGSNLSNVNGSVPAVAATGGTNGLVSVDALEEFKIQTSTYAAEFGRSPGAQVSLVTRSGTNEFRGSVFNYLRNDVFDANDWFANANRLPKPPLRQNDFGAVVGGPLLIPRFGSGGRTYWSGKNRSFFFFSYEGLRLRVPQVAVWTVPSLNLRQSAPQNVRPLLNAFPVPNGRDFGNGMAQFSGGYSDPSSLNATSIRIDHSVNSSLSVFGRYNRSTSFSSRRDTGPLSIRLNSSDADTLTFGTTMVLLSRISNDLRINFSRSRGAGDNVLDTFGGAVVPSESILFGPTVNSRNTESGIFFNFAGGPNFRLGLTAENLQRQLNIVDTLFLVAGAHQLKFGFDFRRLSADLLVSNFRSVAFTSQTAVQNSLVSALNYRAQGPTYPIYTNYSVFAQDTWKMSSRLTLSYGLRWEVNPPPSSADGRLPLTLTQIDNPATFTFAPPGTDLYKTTYNNFAPRVGLAFLVSPHQERETILRGGFGIFYDLGNGQASLGFNAPPFRASAPARTNIRFPLDPSIDIPPALGVLTPPLSGVIAVDPDLRLPYTYQWNLALEQSLGTAQSVSASYIAAVGRRLTGQVLFPNPNPTFTFLGVVTNEFTSDYHSLQIQFQRRLSRGLQAITSYTWSHAIDDVSLESVDQARARGSADFDVRHNFSAALTYNLPATNAGVVAGALLRNWSVDGIIHAQTATPFNLTAVSNANIDGLTTSIRPDLIAGIPLYLDDPKAPGGRRLNNTIDASRPNCKGPFCRPPAGRQGSLGRNVVRGHSLAQIDLALRRQFNLSERFKLQFRTELFNVFNHPNFADPNNILTSGLFGESTQMLNRGLGGAGLNQLYQIGGPRSIQLAIKLSF